MHAPEPIACPDLVDQLLDPLASLGPRFFKALGEPNRMELLVTLARAGRPCRVGEVAADCPLDLSVVSRHLAHLRDAGLLRAEKRGRAVYYWIGAGPVVTALRVLADALEQCAGREERSSCV